MIITPASQMRRGICYRIIQHQRCRIKRLSTSLLRGDTQVYHRLSLGYKNMIAFLKNMITHRMHEKMCIMDEHYASYDPITGIRHLHGAAKTQLINHMIDLHQIGILEYVSSLIENPPKDIKDHFESRLSIRNTLLERYTSCLPLLRQMSERIKTIKMSSDKYTYAITECLPILSHESKSLSLQNLHNDPLLNALIRQQKHGKALIKFLYLLELGRKKDHHPLNKFTLVPNLIEQINNLRDLPS